MRLIVGKGYRRDGIGSRLVAAVEDAYKGKGYDKSVFDGGTTK